MLPDPGAPVSLTPLADAVLADATLAEAMADAKAGLVRALDLTGPEALRPFVVAGLVADGPHGAGGHRRPAARPRTSSRSSADLVDPARVGYYPSWETLPHERLSPRSDTVGRRLAVLRRLCHPGTDETNGPLSVVVAPVRSVLQPQVKGLGDLEPVELTPGDDGAARRRRTPPGRRGVHPRRPGREARRVRGPRRHRRRVPADRGAPAAGGVLGRRGRGDPQRSRSPTSARSRRSSGCGRRRAASCCSPTRSAAAPGSWARRTPQLRGAHRQDRRRHRGRGHGVAGAGARRRDGAARRPAARRHPRAGPRPRACPARAPTTWWRPARSSSAPAGPRPPAAARRRSTSAPRRTSSLGDVRVHRSRAATPGGRCRRSASTTTRCWRASRSGTSSARSCRSTSTCWSGPCRRGRCRPGRPTPTAATSSARSPTSAAGWPTDYRVVGRAPRPRPGPADGRGCSASTTWRRGSSTTRDVRTRDVVTVTCGDAHPRLRRRRSTGWRCSPATTSPARRPRPATCGRCRPGASGRSTRSS